MEGRTHSEAMSAKPAPLVLALPVFNGERYLARTLESLNAQGENVRWWLQDGGSTDRTVEIARSYARPGDTVVSEPDGGQADAINRAMRRMGGEIIGFINADDLLAPEAARRVVAFFAQNAQVDLVYGSVQWIDENGTATGTHTGHIESLDDALDIYGVWWNQRQWVQPEVFYRRSLWERAGGFDTTRHLAFDYDFWVCCFLAGARVAHLPAILASFRLHPGQKSAAAERAADEIRAIVKKHLPGAPASAVRRWAIEAQLDYDLYQSGKAGCPRGDFLSEFVRNPKWMLSPQARSRAQAACARLLIGNR
jgi:glycosyltransferase involved in cell wall biosynthesis